MQDVGIGELGGQGSARDVALQRRQGAFLCRRGEIFLGKVGLENGEHLGVGRAELPEKALA